MKNYQHTGLSHKGPSQPSSHLQVRGILSLQIPFAQPGSFRQSSQEGPVQPYLHLTVIYHSFLALNKVINELDLILKVYFLFLRIIYDLHTDVWGNAMTVDAIRTHGFKIEIKNPEN